MEDAVTCAVCHEIYESGLRDPLVLPCGHTQCRECLVSLRNTCVDKPFACPLCRTFHPFLSIHSLPVNFSLLSLSNSYAENRSVCVNHSGPNDFWCRHCVKAVCGMCLLTGHLREGHDVITADVVVQEKRSRFNDDATSALRNIKEIQRKATSHFGRFLENVMLLSAASDVLSEMGKTVEALQEKATRIKGIEQMLVHETELNDQVLAKKMGKLLTITNLGPETRKAMGGVEDATVLSQPAVSLLLRDLDDGMSSEGSSNVDSATDESLSEKLPLRPEDYEHTEDTLGMGELKREVFEGMGEQVMNCKVHVGDGRHGQLAWEDEQLLLYALAPAHKDPQVLIKFSAIATLLDRSHPMVFLDLSAGERHLGRVYITLRGFMRRAQQFLALCVGIMGPSFVGSTFTRVNDKGQAGEALVGGKYYCRRAKRFVAKGLIENLERGDKHWDVDRAGLVADYSGGLAKLDTLFGICTTDNQGMDLMTPVFGEVTEGLDVVAAAAQHDPVKDVAISRCGLVVPLRAPKDPLSSIIDALSIS